MIALAAAPGNKNGVDSALLRQLASPEGQALLLAAADALDERDRLLARIAELEAAQAPG